MDNFTFHIPTKVFFGKGQVSNLGSAIKEFGGSKVLLAYGGGSVKRNGIYDDVVEQLNEHALEFIELSDIKPNPRIESVEEGIALYRENNCDFILAVGGGSTLDACKAIAAGVSYEGSVMDLLTGKVQTSNPAPLGTILTMAGTGSELDAGGVITAGEDNKKFVLMHPELYPKFSILDPVYTFTVPEHHSMAGCADILCHLMEQYFTTDSGAHVQDSMNEGMMKVVLEHAPNVLSETENYDARASVMWASSMALAGFQLLLGKPMFMFPIHYIGHELSSLYDMTHGVSLAVITPAWMRHTMRVAPEHTPLFARFARNVFAVCEDDDAQAAEEGVQRLISFYERINMPASLQEAGAKEEDLRYLAKKAVENGKLGILTSIGEEEAYEILCESFYSAATLERSPSAAL